MNLLYFSMDIIMLWCCTRNSIWILNRDLNILSAATLKGPMEYTEFMCTPPIEWILFSVNVILSSSSVFHKTLYTFFLVQTSENFSDLVTFDMNMNNDRLKIL